MIRPNKKNICVSGYMFLKIRVGRSDYFLIFFEIILDLPEVLFIKTELVYLHFQFVAWCHGLLLLHFHWPTI